MSVSVLSESYDYRGRTPANAEFIPDQPGMMAVELWDRDSKGGWRVRLIERTGAACNIIPVEWWVNLVLQNMDTPGLYVIEGITEVEDTFVHESFRFATDDEYYRWQNRITAIHKHLFMRNVARGKVDNEIEHELAVRRYLWKLVLNLAYGTKNKRMAMLGSLYYELMAGTPISETEYAKENDIPVDD